MYQIDPIFILPFISCIHGLARATGSSWEFLLNKIKKSLSSRFLVEILKGVLFFSQKRETSLCGRRTGRACACGLVLVHLPPFFSVQWTDSHPNPHPFASDRGDGDGSGGAGGGCRRAGDVPVGAVRLHAGRIDGGGDVVPQGARRPLRAPRHRLPPLRPPLRLQPPLRCSWRGQLQSHRRRSVLRRRPHQPIPLLRRAPLPSPGTVYSIA